MKDWVKSKSLGFFVKTKGVFSQPLFGGAYAVMLHRVLPQECKLPYPLTHSLAITPDELSDFISNQKSKGFRFITIDELYEYAIGKKRIPSKSICITLDDGYYDNLKYALPIFEKHQVPAIIYVTNYFPNKTNIFWWYLLEQKVIQSSSITWDGEKYEWKNGEEMASVFNQIKRSIKQYPAEGFQDVILKQLGLSIDEAVQEHSDLALSWKDIKKLSQHPLITIGAHTLNHLPLRALKDEQVVDEVKASKIELEQYLGIPIDHFAYPFGGREEVSETVVELLRSNGVIKSAVLNLPGNVFFGKTDALKIPRYPLGSKTTKEKVKCFNNGIGHFSANGINLNIKL